MRRISTLLMAGLCAGIFSLHTPVQAAAEMSLMRLADCGTPQAPVPVNERFSDTFSYGDLKIQFVFSCYLIKHGDQYLLWDTGHSMTAPNVAPKVSIVDQIAQLGVKPEQINFVGISHYHADHTGQVASFPKATLLIGVGDWNAITAPNPAPSVNFKPFEGWIKGDNKVEPQPNDKDVFGDGSVIMLNTPGHTPGHQSLLVNLSKTGPVLLSGDLYHYPAERTLKDFTPFASLGNPQQEIASKAKVEALLKEKHAQLWIQHDYNAGIKRKIAPQFYD